MCPKRRCSGALGEPHPLRARSPRQAPNGWSLFSGQRYRKCPQLPVRCVSALSMAFAMGWEILWPLILGFALSGVVQAVATKGEMSDSCPIPRCARS